MCKLLCVYNTTCILYSHHFIIISPDPNIHVGSNDLVYQPYDLLPSVYDLVKCTLSKWWELIFLPARIRVSGAHTSTVKFCHGFIKQWYAIFPAQFSAWSEQFIFDAASFHDLSSDGHVSTAFLVVWEYLQNSTSMRVESPLTLTWNIWISFTREKY